MPTILSHVTTHDSRPALTIINDGAHALHTINECIPMQINTETRYCTGWYDLTKRQRHCCPDSETMVDTRYHECHACRQRTGFNPAFYHATHVSPQQQERNSQPHIVYLALFGTKTIKVGISHAKRDLQRLYEQGAWAAMVLGTYADAHIARQHEATLAALPELCETVQLKKKITLLTSQSYDEKQAEHTLQTTKQHIESTLKTDFSEATFYSLYQHYFIQPTDCIDAVDITNDKVLVGECVGMIGGVVVCRYNSQIVVAALKKYIGYEVSLQATNAVLELPAQQMSLL